ncbi:MAG: endonuclease/exonuclease/phosphatase family protein [Cyclobacteriaceae bacterium]
MKSISNLIIVLVILCSTTSNICGQELKVMSYNIRYDSPNDGENLWPLRRDFLASQIAFYEPDIFGIQEGLYHQVKYLDTQLGEYTYLGIGRNGGDKGEYSAIFFKNEKYKVIQQSTFWLSKTRDKPSKNWDASLPRICTYALFQDIESKEKFWFFNTHLDHRGAQSRAESVKLILARIIELNMDSLPVILTGDLNMQPNDPTIVSLSQNMSDTYSISAEKPFGPVGTFNGFDITNPLERRIDYIFISDPKKIQVNKYAALSDIKDSKYPSDHLPVFVEVSLKK